jgi:hypothetical protein
MNKLLIPTSFKVLHIITIIVMIGMFETATYLLSHRKRGAVRFRKSHTVQYLLLEHSTGRYNTLQVTRTQHQPVQHSTSY